MSTVVKPATRPATATRKQESKQTAIFLLLNLSRLGWIVFPIALAVMVVCLLVAFKTTDSTAMHESFGTAWEACKVFVGTVVIMALAETLSAIVKYVDRN